MARAEFERAREAGEEPVRPEKRKPMHWPNRQGIVLLAGLPTTWEI